MKCDQVITLTQIIRTFLSSFLAPVALSHRGCTSTLLNGSVFDVRDELGEKNEIKTLNIASKSEEEGRGNKIVKDEIFRSDRISRLYIVNSG